MYKPGITQEFSYKDQSHDFFIVLKKFYQRWFREDLNESSQSMESKETRLPRLLELTMITLSAATILFLIWSGLTPIKELARTEGQVLTNGYSQLVQHLEGGLVREILVHEGDFVQKDQLLVRLDGAGLEEDYLEQKVRVEALSLQAERLKSLLNDEEPNFSKISKDSGLIKEQKRMYESTLEAKKSELAVLDKQIAQKENIIARIGYELETARSNLVFAKENKEIYSKLHKKGLTSRTNYLKKEEELNSQQGKISSLTEQMEESKRELEEFSKRRQTMAAQQRDSFYTELHAIESELAQAQENLKKRNNRVARLEVRAPVMGYIQGLKINTIGSVIPAGQTLMEIVPVDEVLIVEARILPQQIGRVAVGQEVQVRVDSYDYVRYGTIPAKLESISAMTFTDEVRRQDYYKGRVKLSRNYAGSNPEAHLVMPGMTVDADIVTGEKSILGYLLKPIQVAMHNAMREQ